MNKTTEQMNREFYNSLPKNAAQFVAYKKVTGFSKKKHTEIFSWNERVVQPWTLSGDNHIAELMSKNKSYRSTYISLAQYYGGNGTKRKIKEGRLSPAFDDSRPTVSRSIASIHSIDRIVIDIDPGNHFISFNDGQIRLITDIVSDYHIIPDFIISSGHGIQIVFLFVPVSYVTKRFSRKYDEVVASISEELSSMLSEYLDVQIDRLKVNSVYRLPGSYNYTAGTKANVIVSNFSEDAVRKTFNDFCDAVAVPVFQNGLHAPKNIKKAADDEFTAAKERVSESNEKFLQKMTHDYKVMAMYISKEASEPVGWRNTLLYCYARNIMQAVSNRHVVLSCALNINESCERPLSESEVRIICRHAETDYKKNPRVYSFESQLNWLKKHSRVFRGIPTDRFFLPIDEAHRQEHKKQSIQKAHKAETERRKEDRRQSKAEKIEEVKLLYSEGKNVMDIHNLTGFSRTTIYKYLNLQD